MGGDFKFPLSRPAGGGYRSTLGIEWAPGGAPRSGRIWVPKNKSGRKSPHANVAPVAFRAASGDYLGNYTQKVAMFAHPTDATGTKGDFEGETTSIEASFDFHPLKTRELNQIPARWPFWGAHHLQGDTSGAS